MKDRSGFTIIEVLTVIVVISILAALVIGGFTFVQNQAKDTTVQTDIRGSGLKVEEFFASQNRYPQATQAELQDLLYVKKTAYFIASSGSASYCRSDAGFTLYGRSASGNAYIYSSKDGLKGVTQTGNLNEQCTRGGINSTDAGFGSIWLLKGSSNPEGAGWQTWVKGED